MKPTLKNIYIVCFICLIPVMYFMLKEVNNRNRDNAFLAMLDKQIVFVKPQIDTTDGIHLDVVPDTELWED